MAVTPFKTFSAGEILTASDLNSSFAQVFDNGEDLGWPASQAKDFNGVELILDADGDTSITSDTDDQIDVKIAGTDRIVIKGGAANNILDLVSTATTTGNVIDIGDADALTTGSILNLVSNSADTNTRNLAFIHNQNTAATAATALKLQQDAARKALFIDQNGNGNSIEIDSEATTADVFFVNADPTTTGDVFFVTADGLTTGSILNLVSDSTSTGTRSLGFIHNDNTLATGTTILSLQQDAAQRALFIDQNGNDTSIEIDAASTTSNVISVTADSTTIGAVILVSADALTAGKMMLLESNSSSASSRNLAAINNINSSATGATPLYLSQSANNGVLRVDALNASMTGIAQEIYGTRAASTAYSFAKYYSSAGSDVEFNFRGDGEAFADGSFTGGGADYAEYYEWEDGNPTNEDRRGIVVDLIGDKIRPATESSTAETIWGVISGNPSVVGDSAWNKWADKYITDDFGSYVMEEYEVWSWTVTNKNGIEEGMVFEADKIPDDMEVPREKEVTVQLRRKLNPEFNPDLEYIPREKRKEWDCVGLMGKLRVRKGQPIKPGWKKMREISETVEEWSIR
jgi:hypothetical protein